MSQKPKRVRRICEKVKSKCDLFKHSLDVCPAQQEKHTKLRPKTKKPTPSISSMMKFYENIPSKQIGSRSIATYAEVKKTTFKNHNILQPTMTFATCPTMCSRRRCSYSGRFTVIWVFRWRQRRDRDRRHGANVERHRKSASFRRVCATWVDLICGLVLYARHLLCCYRIASI